MTHLHFPNNVPVRLGGSNPARTGAHIIGGSAAAVVPAALPYGIGSSTDFRGIYALRKIVSTYTGPAIRVRRADNTETNINFNGGGLLDESALTAFVGSGFGRVATWYDQSASAQNLTQADPNKMPTITNGSGVIHRSTGGVRPMIMCEDTGTTPGPHGFMRLGYVTPATDNFAVMVAYETRNVNEAGLVALRDETDTVMKHGALFVLGGQVWADQGALPGGNSIYAYGPGGSTATPYVIASTPSIASSVYHAGHARVFHNNVGGPVQLTTLTLTTPMRIRIGYGSENSGYGTLNGAINELVICGNTTTADQTAIFASMRIYMGVSAITDPGVLGGDAGDDGQTGTGGGTGGGGYTGGGSGGGTTTGPPASTTTPTMYTSYTAPAARSSLTVGTQVGTMTLENAGATSLAAGTAVSGLTFLQGDLPAGMLLQGKISGTNITTQTTIKATYSDGSAKHAVVAVARPTLAAAATAVVTFFSKSSADAAALNFDTALAGHTLSVLYTPRTYDMPPPEPSNGIPYGQELTYARYNQPFTVGSPETINVITAMQAAISAGTVDTWISGPLAVSKRFTIDRPDAQRFVFDVMCFASGAIQIDAQFNNDGAMGLTGGRKDYTLTVTLDGTAVMSNQLVNQVQYQRFHRTFRSANTDGHQGHGKFDTGWLHVRHDMTKLIDSAALPHIDLTLPVSRTNIAGQNHYDMIRASGWNAPFDTNGIAVYMAASGYSSGIGYSTAQTNAWVIAQDPYTAEYCRGQCEAFATLPINFWEKAVDLWLSTMRFPDLQLNRGPPNPVVAANAGSNALLQDRDTPINTYQRWEPDGPHQPHANFIPYVLTGQRWMLDNLLAQAHWGIVGTWEVPRQGSRNIVCAWKTGQIRGTAWSMRQIQDAAWICPENLPDSAYLKTSINNNWTYLTEYMPAMEDDQGTVHGYYDPGEYDRFNDGIAMWQSEFLFMQIATAARRGNPQAISYFNWSNNFYLGRYSSAAQGYPRVDGLAEAFCIYDRPNNTKIKTWAAVEAAMVARNGNVVAPYTEHLTYHPDAAFSALATIYRMTNDARALTAYNALIALNLLGTKQADCAVSPTFPAMIPGNYGS